MSTNRLIYKIIVICAYKEMLFSADVKGYRKGK
jgi:hypothetical protein